MYINNYIKFELDLTIPFKILFDPLADIWKKMN